MAMIQVVVTLSEEDYNLLVNVNDDKLPSMIARDHLHEQLKTGIVLSKGHGRLIDADKLDDAFYSESCECDFGYGECSNIIDEAPTVVEADEQELKEAAASEEIQKEHIENDSGSNRMKFILNGCDISFIAEAPEDMTVKQLIEQADRIEPDWCACGVCKDTGCENYPTEIVFDYNSVRKASDDVCCEIRQV